MRRHIIAVLATASLVVGGLGVIPAQAATPTTGTVKIKVVLPGGAPVPGVSVSLQIVADDEWGSDYGVTGDDGTYTTEELTPGSYALEASLWLSGKDRKVTRTITVKAGVNSTETVTLTGVQRIHGKVTVGGKTLATGSVEVTSGTSYVTSATIKNGAYSAIVESGKTYGAYVPPPWDGAHTYLMTYAGSTVREVDAAKIVVKAGADARVDIAAYAKLGTLTGTVRNEKGKPVGGAYVFASATDRSAWRSVVARSDGRYTLDGLPPGHYVLSASTDRYDLGVASTSKTYTVVAGRTASTSVTVRKPVTHKGAIVLKIKASSTVWKRTGGICASAMTTKNLWAGIACADRKTKKLKISNLPAGTYNVRLNGANTSYKIVVRKNRTTTKTVTRPKGTPITGVVRASSGKVLAKASVSIYDSYGTYLGTATTSTKGRYTVNGATKGRYTVNVDAANPASGVTPSKTLTVTKGRKATLNVRLVKGASIVGKITTTSGKGIAGMQVSAYGTAGYASTTTNSRGEYKLTGLRKGSFKVSSVDPYMGGYYNTKTITVKVATGTSKRAATLSARAG